MFNHRTSPRAKPSNLPGKKWIKWNIMWSQLPSRQLHLKPRITKWIAAWCWIVSGLGRWWGAVPGQALSAKSDIERERGGQSNSACWNEFSLPEESGHASIVYLTKQHLHTQFLPTSPIFQRSFFFFFLFHWLNEQVEGESEIETESESECAFGSGDKTSEVGQGLSRLDNLL